MLLDIGTFRKRTRFDLEALIGELQAETRRATPAEASAWKNSLPILAEVMSHPSLGAFHMHIGGGSMMVEYRLPASPCWADIVLLGRGKEKPAAVIVELKDWKSAGDRPGTREALVIHAGHEVSHPSDQVRGYTEYCQRFHSAVQECGADVAGCVFFTFSGNVDPYREQPHHRLTSDFPVFARTQSDMEEALPRYLTERLVMPDVEFARRFESGTYQQDRGFVLQIAEAIKRPETSPFVLLDKQREGFELCMACVERRLKPAKASAKTANGKSVVVIEGPPGSGKSIIAAQLWASLCRDDKIDGNIVLTTTSVAQRTNWEHLFERTIGHQAARGVVIGANQYNPGLSQRWLKQQRDAGHPTTIQTWRDNLERFTKSQVSPGEGGSGFAVSIVDEAHGLIDPTVEGRAGMSASGWMLHAGPQAWHVIRSSKVAIFLLDPEQSYRDNETTTVEKIKEFALEFGADFTQVSLAGAQFRCGGSVEYIDWVERALEIPGRSVKAKDGFAATSWQRIRGGPFECKCFDDPQALEDALREQVDAGHTARLASSYARRWKSKGVADPHHLPPDDQDFNIAFTRAGVQRRWTRIWNYAPDQDYSLFVQAPPGSATASDPLCEVGCPYVLRGFDFDYIGLLWMSDLVWRTDRWVVALQNVHESAWRLTAAHAHQGQPGAEAEVVQRLKRGYRILLSRAIRGTYIWFEDQETREYMQSLL